MKKRILLSIISSVLLIEASYGKENVNNLDELIITAQKIEQNIQEVPISVTILDAQMIKDNNIRTITDVASYVSNFSGVNVSSGIYYPSMRGLSTDGHTYTTTVATYVDGVPYLNAIGNNLVLNDIERIEVLKGPQGTLYGKNAYAGVINIITKKPNNEVRGEFKVELGEDNKREYSFNLSAPLVKDMLFASISASHYEKDGQIENTYLNKTDDDRENNSGKLHLRYLPNDDLDISWITSKVKKDDDSPLWALSSDETPYTTQSDFEGYTTSSIFSSVLQVNYAMDNMNLSSLSSVKDYTDERGADYDMTSSSITYASVDSKYKEYSQEFKLDGKNGDLQWLTGFYMDKNKADNNLNYNEFTFVSNKQDVKSMALYGNVDYQIQNDLIFTAGIRYDRDKVKLSTTPTTFIPSQYSDEKTDTEISPKIGIKYFYQDNIMPYATISKGYKRGGFNLFNFNSTSDPYEKETLWNYELGFKSQAFDNKLTLNLAIFYMDIKDMQVLTYVDSTPFTYVENAAEATSKGFEVETNYKITSNLDIFSSFGYTKIKFDKFESTQATYDGHAIKYSPKYTYSLGTSYRADNGIFAKVDMIGRSSIYSDDANLLKNDGYTIFNTKIGYESKNYEIYLYSDNLTDKNYAVDGGSFTYLSEGRETGISLVYKF